MSTLSSNALPRAAAHVGLGFLVGVLVMLPIGWWLWSGKDATTNLRPRAENERATPGEASAAQSNDEAMPDKTAAFDPAIPTPTDPRPLVVSVRGAVAAPDVYRFPSDARVQDAIDRAGGIVLEADISDINIAAPLEDGTTLTIPAGGSAKIDGNTLRARGIRETAAALNLPRYTRSGWRPSAPPATTAADTPGHAPQTATSNGKLNLNTASAEELATLPGIGPITAQKIITHREAAPFETVDDLRNVHGIGEGRLESMRPHVTVQ